MATRAKTFTYETGLRWDKGLESVASAPGKPDIRVSAPPEFKGPEGQWAPENLYVSSIESCLLFTFLALAKSRKLDFTAYHSQAEGLLEPVMGKLVVSTVTVRPTITVRDDDGREKALAIVESMEANCFISNSVESEIVIKPEIVVASE